MKLKRSLALALLPVLIFPMSAFPDEKEREKDTRPFCKTVDEAANWVL